MAAPISASVKRGVICSEQFHSKARFRNRSYAEHRLDLGGDLRGVFVEHEMAAVEPDQLGLGQIIQVGPAPGGMKNGSFLPQTISVFGLCSRNAACHSG